MVQNMNNANIKCWMYTLWLKYIHFWHIVYHLGCYNKHLDPYLISLTSLKITQNFWCLTNRRTNYFLHYNSNHIYTKNLQFIFFHFYPASVISLRRKYVRHCNSDTRKKWFYLLLTNILKSFSKCWYKFGSCFN